MNKPEMIEILDGIRSFYGDSPSIGVIAENLKVSEEEALDLWSEYIEELGKKPVVVPKKKRPAKKRPAKKADTAPAVKKVHKKKNLFHDIAILCLPYGAAAIAILALVRSVLFSFNYFQRTEDVGIAWLVSALLGLVILLGPSILIHGIQTRKWAVVTIAAIAVIMFGVINVYITVEELNHTKMVKEEAYTKNQEDILRGRARLPVLEAEIIANTSNLERDDAEYKQLLANSKKAFEEDDMVVYNRTRNNMATVQERINNYKEIDKTLKAERTTIQNTEGFYTQTVLTIEDKARARMMDLMFGISLEVVGAVFLSLALFM